MSTNTRIEQKRKHNFALLERSDLHLLRRIQHAFTGIIFLCLSYIIPLHLSVPLLVLGTLALLILHYLRKRYSLAQKVFMRLFASVLREHERTELSGAFYFLFGTTVVFMMFPIDIARTSLMCLSIGDPMAAVVGITVGGLKLDKRTSISGCVACFSSSFLFGSLFLGSVKERFFASLACTLGEAISHKIGVDDNLMIPVITSIALVILRFL